MKVCNEAGVAEVAAFARLAWPGLLDVTDRKHWEVGLCLRDLFEAGLLRPGVKILGFGVGREPLPAYFRSLGLDVTATDMDPDAPAAVDWTTTGQHAGKGVYREVDMNAIPADLCRGEFDATWSLSSLEHIGGIEAGIKFLEAQMACLKPGGRMVHITELNLSGDQHTLDAHNLAFFRRRDILAAVGRLRAAGLECLDPVFEPSPEAAGLRVAACGFDITSFALLGTKKTD